MPLIYPNNNNNNSESYLKGPKLTDRNLKVKSQNERIATQVDFEFEITIETGPKVATQG